MKYVDKRFVISIVCFSLLLLFIVQFVPLCFAINFDEATEVIESAEYDLNMAFEAAKAGKSGKELYVISEALKEQSGYPKQ